MSVGDNDMMEGEFYMYNFYNDNMKCLFQDIIYPSHQ